MIIALAVPFAVLAGGLFLLMYAHTLSAHSGSSVDKKASGGFWGAFRQALLVTNPLAVAIESAVSWVLGNARGFVSHWALASVKPVARWLDGLTELHRRTYAQMSGLATDTANAMQMFRHHVIPHEVAAKVAPVATVANHASKTASTALTRTTALSETFTNTHRAQVKLNVRYSHAIDIALPRQIGAINTEIDRLRTDQTKLRERTSSLENGATKTWEWIRTHPLSLVTGAFAGAVAIALQRIDLGGLRCRNFTNLLKNYGCGLGTLLGRLLPLAVFLTVAFDFEDFVKASRAVAVGLGDAVASIEGTFNPHLPPLPPPRG